MLSLIGLIAALALLIVLTIRGMNLFVATPLCAILVALTAGLPLMPQLAADGQANLLTSYMSGFTGFIANWFFMFLLGSIFGKLMEDTGAADSVARWVVRGIGPPSDGRSTPIGKVSRYSWMKAASDTGVIAS